MSSSRGLFCSWLAFAAACSVTSTQRASGGGHGTDGRTLDAGGSTLPHRGDAGSSAGDGIDTGSSLPPCDHAASEDGDDDGLSGAQGDCYDCDARVNPGAYDFPDNGIDEDCADGDATQQDYACDDGLALDSFEAKDGARAIGLCVFAEPTSKHWGVLSARYTISDGSRALTNAIQVGLLPAFGAEKPRAGKAMFAVSSGVARAPDQPGAIESGETLKSCGSYFTSGQDPWPMGYPAPSPACDAGGGGGGGGGWSDQVFDPAALELEIRVPTNARALSFDTDFYTYEYPSFICSQYNDYFLALLDPPPADHPDGNVVFDAEGNWISVNNGLLQVCSPGMHQGKTFTCPLGTARLANTGYDDDDTLCMEGAATGWLHTVVPVEPGSTIRLRFVIWDTNDPNRDSTALVDNVQWDVDAPDAIATEPVEVL